MTQAQLPELTCRELIELVTDYVEGRLSPGDRARFEAHLAECDACETYLVQMRQTIRALGRLPEPEEIAAAIVYLCTPAARSITGITLPVDSGFLAR